MVFLKSIVLLFSLAASTSALATPHAIRHVANHHAIAARVAAPAPLEVPSPASLRKRQNTRRCKQRSSAAPVATPSAAAAAAAAPSSAQPVAVPATTKKQAPATTTEAARTTKEAPPATTTKEAAPTTTKEHTTKAAPTTPAPAPSPTTTKAPAPAPTTKATGGGNSNLPSFMVGTQTGQGTFYATGLGACGIVNTDADFIAAVSHLLYDNFPGYDGVNPNNNPMCGRKVTAHYQGKTVTVALTDRCVGCALTDLDFSPSAFNTLADPSVGRISGMTWTWN